MSDAPTTPVPDPEPGTPPPAAATPPPPVEDDDSLIGDTTEFERQLLDQFRNPDAVTDTPTDPRAAAPEQPSPGPGGEGSEPPPAVAAVSGEVAPDETPTPSTTPEGAPPEGTPPPAPPAAEADLWDTYDDPAQVQQQAKSLVDWYANLDQAQVQTIDAALSGEYVLVPAAQVAELQARWDQLQQPAAPTQPAAPSAPNPAEYGANGYEPEGTGDPILAAQLAATRQEVAQLQATQMQSQIDQQVAKSAEQIATAADAWVAAHPELTEADVAAVQNQALQSGIYGPLAARYGDAEATRMALEQAAAVVPTVQQKVLNARAAQLAAEQATQIAQQQAAGTRASAISGAGTTPPDLSGLSPDDAMVEEIRQGMGLG